MSPSLILLELLNLQDGRKPSAWLSELTGLNQSRFRQDQKYCFRDSTIRKVKKKVLSKLDQSDIGQVPTLKNNYSSPFQDFVYFTFKKKDLPLYNFAENIDLLDSALEQAYKAESIVDLKKILFDCEWLKNESYWTVDQKNLKEALDACQHFDVAIVLYQQLNFNIFLSFLAALDCTLCDLCFGTKLKLRPIFLDLLPTANFETNINDNKISVPTKDKFRLPNRRLLELTHATFYFAKNRKWPEKPVGRKELSEKTGYQDTVIGNFYDGTKKLTLRLYDKIQQQLDKNVGLNKNTNTFAALHLASAFWLKCFVEFDSKNKVKSVFLYDKIGYLNFWNYHAQAWANQLDAGNTDWPTWLN